MFFRASLHSIMRFGSLLTGKLDGGRPSIGSGPPDPETARWGFRTKLKRTEGTPEKVRREEAGRWGERDGTREEGGQERERRGQE